MPMGERHVLLAAAAGVTLAWVLLTAIAAEPPSPKGVAVVAEVSKLHSRKGNILAALYAGPVGFPDDTRKAFALSCEPASAESIRCRFEDVPPGEYAIVVFHDENGNGKLDKGFWGKPKEEIGASNNPSLRRRAPRFEESMFRVEEGGTSVGILLQY